MSNKRRMSKKQLSLLLTLEQLKLDMNTHITKIIAVLDKMMSENSLSVDALFFLDDNLPKYKTIKKNLELVMIDPLREHDLLAYLAEIVALDDSLKKAHNQKYITIPQETQQEMKSFLSRNKVFILAAGLMLIGITLMFSGPLGIAPAIAAALKAVSIVAAHQTVVLAGYCIAGVGATLVTASSLYAAVKADTAKAPMHPVLYEIGLFKQKYNVHLPRKMNEESDNKLDHITMDLV
jgi:hypothetical protein